MTIRAYRQYIQDLLDHPDIQRLQEIGDHHWKRSRLEHNYAVGKLAFRLARIFQANVNVAARAGFLHDWYHGHMPDRQLFINPDQHHFRQSHANAKQYGEHPAILHAIRVHYWPFGRVVPKTREAWIVWMADNLMWVVDYWQSLKISLRQWGRGIVYGTNA